GEIFMTPAEFKNVIETLRKKLKIIMESHFFTNFQFHEEIPFDQGQYWEYEITLVTNDKYMSRVSCGFFTSTGRLRNKELSINNFFANNDDILYEFLKVGELGLFREIIPELKKIYGLEGTGLDGALNVFSYIAGGDDWLQQVCEEYVLILSIEGSNLHIGCQQNERIRIELLDQGKNMYYFLPFDKADSFEGHERIESDSTKAWQYDVALSFAGEDRKYVDEIAENLKSIGIKVFYDQYETVTLWGKDLYLHLDDIYRNKSMYCVMFLSNYYKNKVWTNHERESAQARAFEEKAEYILPIRIDETEIPGIKPTTGYISANEYSTLEISGFIQKKIKDYLTS
ncbi:toll/interleukin-1 receptor domain-containing protein, partial [Priestia megaterium]|uniref:toll/interleukin-1 receptor domain-containing protein n=1 Tax=Priestia megaterium TaxID=1404 RepID=UPI001D1769C0